MSNGAERQVTRYSVSADPESAVSTPPRKYTREERLGLVPLPSAGRPVRQLPAVRTLPDSVPTPPPAVRKPTREERLRGPVSKEDMAEQRMQDVIHQRISGLDAQGMPLSGTEHREYIKLNESLKDKELERQEREARLTMEQEKQQFQFHLEDRKLELETERVQIAKAEVVVRALEVAAKSGVDGTLLLTAITNFSDKLLSSTPGTPSAAKQLLSLTDTQRGDGE